MSFGIVAAGRIDDVIRQVQAAQGRSNTEQFRSVKALILAELEAWPPCGPFNGALIEAHGSSAVCNLYISIRPLHLRG